MLTYLVHACRMRWLASASQALAPLLRIPASVQASDNSDGAIRRNEEQTVWESSEQRSMQFTMNNREPLWRPGDVSEAGIDRAQKIGSETLRLPLVPKRSVSDVGFRVRANDQVVH